MGSDSGDVDERRELFNKYLAQASVPDELVLVLTRMYNEPEWPDRPLHYIRRYLGAMPGDNLEELRAENEDLKFKNAELEATVDSLMTQLENFERGTDN